MTNILILTGRLSQDWEEITAKSSGKPFQKNMLRGKSGYDNTNGERIEKDWAIELIAFSHTGNSLRKHTGKGDIIAVTCQLKSNERDSNDGTRTFLNHSADVRDYEVLVAHVEPQHVPASHPSNPKPGDNPDYSSIPFAVLISAILSFGALSMSVL
jgi:single-stranded DNA-binding protein